MIKYKKIYKNDDYTKICDKEILEELLTYEKITLLWGAEYVHFVNVKKHMCPQEGSSSLLGIVVPLMGYNSNNFIDLIKSAKPSNILFYGSPEKGLSDSMIKIFKTTTTTMYKDYPEAITYLERDGFVTTYPSISDLRTDDRRFSILPKAIGVLCSLKKYENNSFEVDSLGTIFFSELSELIEELVHVLKV